LGNWSETLTDNEMKATRGGYGAYGSSMFYCSYYEWTNGGANCQKIVDKVMYDGDPSSLCSDDTYGECKTPLGTSVCNIC